MQAHRVLFTCIVPFILCFGCSFDPFSNELMVTVYESPEEVAEAEPGPRTWLPCLMPDEFESYTEMHRVDANHRAGVFEVTPEISNEFYEMLRESGTEVDNTHVAFVNSFRTRQTADYIKQYHQLVRLKPWYRVSCPDRGTFDYFVDSETDRIYYVSVR